MSAEKIGASYYVKPRGAFILLLFRKRHLQEACVSAFNLRRTPISCLKRTRREEIIHAYHVPTYTIRMDEPMNTEIDRTCVKANEGDPRQAA